MVGVMNTQNDQVDHLEMVNDTLEADTNLTTEAQRTQSRIEEVRHELQEEERSGLTTERTERREEMRWRRSDLGVEEVEAWEEPVEGATLLNELRSALSRHVVLPPHAAE